MPVRGCGPQLLKASIKTRRAYCALLFPPTSSLLENAVNIVTYFARETRASPSRVLFFCRFPFRAANKHESPRYVRCRLANGDVNRETAGEKRINFSFLFLSLSLCCLLCVHFAKSRSVRFSAVNSRAVESLLSRSATS